MFQAGNINGESSFYISTNNDHSLSRTIDFIRKGYKLMVLVRGLPGSGKTYLATKLLNLDVGNAKWDEFLFSTNDFFNETGRYMYEPHKLEDAHTWNQRRAFKSTKNNRSPIIIDSCNLEIREMKAYCTMAVQFGYIIEIVEVATPWALNPIELMVRNVHDVDEETIQSMLIRYEQGVTVGQLLATFELTYAMPLPQYRECLTQADLSSNSSSSVEDEVMTNSKQLEELRETISKQSGIMDKISRQLEETKDTILKFSEAMKEIKNEVMEYIVSVITVTKTKLMLISV